MYGVRLKPELIPRLYRGLLFIGVFAITTLQGQEIDVTWKPREDLKLTLPKSVRVYTGVGQLADQKPIKAVYAEIDLSDKNLKLRSIGYSKHRETTLETAKKNKGLLAVNGGYFADDHSVSLIVQDGEVVDSGEELQKGAFGIEKGKPKIVWTQPNSELGMLEKLTSLGADKTGEEWRPTQAVGGGPVLLKNGEITLDYLAEGFGKSHDLRHPRTAVGYKEDGTLLLMVVDGRQEASVGVTLEELAQLLQEREAYEAVNLDGGGSSTFVAKNEVINVPTDISGGNRNSLRKNAGALIISEALPSASDTIYQFDTESEVYSESGIWETSEQVNYYGISPARKAAANSYNKSHYRFKDLPGGWYQLSVWNPVDPEKDEHNQIQYILQGKNSRERTHVDQYAVEDFAQWKVLGNFFITAGDSLEIQGTGGNEIAVDAIRLIPVEKTPDLPARGDFRMAVISDLNAGLGATDYEWQVDSIVNRIPRFWDPDLILAGGDMVAGMGVSDTSRLRLMWQAFKGKIVDPFVRDGIPFAFTLGNHDAHHSHPVEKEFAKAFWEENADKLKVQFIDKKNFPYYYSFTAGDTFFVSWDASSGKISTDNLKWTEKQLQSPVAQKAKNRFVVGHMPFYAVAKERDGRGDLLEHAEELRKILEKYEVRAYISGHQHAYYPGKRGNLELLSAGAAGSGPRSLLGEDTPETNTITIVDLFYDTGEMKYTTYAIKNKNAAKLERIQTRDLPSSIFSQQGYLVRRDVHTTIREADGEFLNSADKNRSSFSGEGRVLAKVTGENEIEISGEFRFNDAKKKFTNRDSIQLFRGKNTEKAALIGGIEKIRKKKDKYTFTKRFEVDGIPGELFAVGALRVVVKTHQGNLQTQLYPKNNQPPENSAITSHHPKNQYGIRNVEALYTFRWDKAVDPDGDKVSYRYELARDSLFTQPLLSRYVGRETELKLKEAELYGFLQKDNVGEPIRFYHRVLSDDGNHLVASEPVPLDLVKSDQPVTGPMEKEPPDYRLVRHIAPGAKGYGAAWDQEGKLWLSDFYKGLLILDEKFQPLPFSPLTEVEWKGDTLPLHPVTGLNQDREGNILVAINQRLIKIDSKSGKPLAVWEVPGENRAVTTPQVSDKGEIYLMSLFPEDDNYILQSDKRNPDTFELLRKIKLKDRILSRDFAMTRDASVLYFPDPGTGKVQVYSMQGDGGQYIEEQALSTENGGSSALYVRPDQSLFIAARTNGIKPSNFRYISPGKKQVWNLPLPELEGAEPRGIGVSPDQKTLIFCSWDKAGGYYVYALKEENNQN